MPSLVETGPVILEKKMKMRKVYEKNNNDDEGQWTNCDQKNSLEPSALNIPYINKNCILPSTE